MSKPHPVSETVVCSECGLPWRDHPEKPSKSDCIRLLIAEIEKAHQPLVTWTVPEWPEHGFYPVWNSDSTGVKRNDGYSYTLHRTYYPASYNSDTHTHQLHTNNT